MKTQHRKLVIIFCFGIIFVLTSCNLPFKIIKNIPSTQTPAAIPEKPIVTENPTAASINPTAPALPSSQTGTQLNFTNTTDGGIVSATMDAQNKPVVRLNLEAKGATFLLITLNANGVQATDSEGRPQQIIATAGSDPLSGTIYWWPQNGGGKYSLTAQAIDINKQFIETTINITVTGVSEFTPMPPAMTLQEATTKISEIFQKNYGVNIPKPALQRFDFPNMPSRSRWIGSAFYAGKFYYVELFDDQHMNLQMQEYASATNRSTKRYSVLCKPAGAYKILVEFVDYGNVNGVNKADLIAQVPVMINWVNHVYLDYMKSQGFSTSPLTLSGEGVYIPTPPVPGDLVTIEQVKNATGIDPRNYDIVIEMDLDKTNAYANKHWSGIFSDAGGGLALQGCGTFDTTSTRVSIWSSMTDMGGIEGSLSMDLTHELSHLFGMYDSWVFIPSGFTFPNGSRGDNWIPFTMFGWIDTDGDGIPEIIDSTPYGTNGPLP